MQDQHKQIKGYRDLTQEEIDLMNRLKQKGEEIFALIQELNVNSETDKRCVALGQTNVQQGFMWLIRSVARPTNFC